MQHLVQALELFFPQAAAALEPHIELLKGLGAQGIDTPLRGRADLHQSGLAEDAEMLGGLGLADSQPGDDAADGERSAGKQLDDLQAAGFGQGAEGVEHAPVCPIRNILVKEYLGRGCGALPYHRGVRAGWQLVLAALLGIWLPWRMGFEFLDAAVLLLYGLLSTAAAAPAIAAALGSEQERPVLDAAREVPEAGALYRAIGRAAAIGWIEAMAVTAAGLATVNLASWHGRVVLPPAGVLASVAALSLGAALLTASAGARAAIEARSAAAAARELRGRCLLLIVAGLAGVRLLPGGWKTWFDAQMTPESLVRNAALATPALALGSAAIALRLARRSRGPRGRDNRP